MSIVGMGSDSCHKAMNGMLGTSTLPRVFCEEDFTSCTYTYVYDSRSYGGEHLVVHVVTAGTSHHTPTHTHTHINTHTHTRTHRGTESHTHPHAYTTHAHRASLSQSYGGYLTAHVMARDTGGVFSCGIVGAALSDRRQYGTSHDVTSRHLT